MLSPTALAQRAGEGAGHLASRAPARRVAPLAVASMLVLGAIACVGRPAPLLGARLTVVNDAKRPVAFTLRIDGTVVLDTVVPPGGIPALVMERGVALRRGRRRIELLDRRLGQQHRVDFEARPGDMTIELRLGRERSRIGTCYCQLGYL